jgi:hypothetical protein
MESWCLSSTHPRTRTRRPTPPRPRTARPGAWACRSARPARTPLTACPARVPMESAVKHDASKAASRVTLPALSAYARTCPPECSRLRVTPLASPSLKAAADRTALATAWDSALFGTTSSARREAATRFRTLPPGIRNATARVPAYRRSLSHARLICAMQARAVVTGLALPLRSVWRPPRAFRARAVPRPTAQRARAPRIVHPRTASTAIAATRRARGSVRPAISQPPSEPARRSRRASPTECAPHAEEWRPAAAHAPRHRARHVRLAPTPSPAALRAAPVRR